MDCLRILQDEKLFTQKDVIFMQFLCKETDCLELNAKCIEYAEKQKALCFFEKPSVNGSEDVLFHVKGDISGYTKEFIREVIETVAAILDCKEEDIHLSAVRYSTSFFLSLSIKKVYIRKLLALKKQDRLSLKHLHIDYLKIGKETIRLNRGEVMTDTVNKRKIIIAMDGSKYSEGALKWFAKNMYEKDRDEVIVLLVTDHRNLSSFRSASYWNPVDPTMIHMAFKEEEEKAKVIIKKLDAILMDAGVQGNVVHVHGFPGEQIVQKSEELGVTMIIIASRGLGEIRRRFLGSVSDYVVYHSSVPVIVCRTENIYVQTTRIK